MAGRRPRPAAPVGGIGLWATVLAITATVVPPTPASAQTFPVGDPFEAYIRLMQISGRTTEDPGSFMVRPLAILGPREVLGATGHPWADRLGLPTSGSVTDFRLRIDDPELRVFANSRYPTGQNDGVIWQGKGLTTAFDAGLTAQWRWLSVAIRPTFVFNQNMSFELAPASSTYAYPWRPIDLPQRFGPDAFWTIDPGQSEVRVGAFGVAAGFGTANMWWGPGIRNSILMSNNAPGIPHGFLGTDGPVDIGIGRLEARWVWGDLDESGYFEGTSPSADRFLTGIALAYSPSFLDGLSLGLGRVFYTTVPEDGTPLSDYFSVFQGVRKKTLASPSNPSGDDEHDQMLSLFARWALAESGFEVYAEWARNDHSWEWRDFLLEPEHSQAYLLGLQKAVELSGDRILALRGELTHLEREPTWLLRGVNPVYYAHHIVRQGYTQKGQIIGAGVGPGGKAQGLAADLYAPWGRVGVLLQRDVRDNDAYYDWAIANGRQSCCHDVLYQLGTDVLLFVGDFDIGAGATFDREFNRWFDGLDLWNLNLSLSARWRPR